MYSGVLKWKVKGNVLNYNDNQVYSNTVQNKFIEVLNMAYGGNLKNVQFSPSPVWDGEYLKVNFYYELKNNQTVQFTNPISYLINFIVSNSSLILAIFSVLTFVATIFVITSGGSVKVDLDNKTVEIVGGGSGFNPL